MTTVLLLAALLTQDPVYSGPQKGEKTPPFKSLILSGEHKGREIDFITEAQGAPSLIVFVHEVTRQAAQVLRSLDEAAAVRPGLKALFVLLSDDMNNVEQRTPVMQNSLKFKTPWAVSPDGREGPGAYGLNKVTTLTILLAKDNRVLANWAITAPSDVDAPPIVKALADLVPADRMMELEAKVSALQRENAALKAQLEKQAPGAAPARRPLVGKAPADPALNGAMRRIIRKDSADADVDAAFKDIDERLKASPELKKEAVDGYMLLIDLKYGGDYAQKRLKEALEALKK